MNLLFQEHDYLRYALPVEALGISDRPVGWCPKATKNPEREPAAIRALVCDVMEDYCISLIWIGPGTYHCPMNAEQLDKVKNAPGFIAALDQSGGSTPKALGLYGVGEDAYTDDEEMFGVVHEMRTRIIKSDSFGGDRVLGAILFENTMDREIDGLGSAEYLWTKKGVVPFLKVDKGLEDEANGVQLMKPTPGLGDLLARAREKGMFGTKMRSVIKLANESGVNAIVDQQFEVGAEIISAGLVPIIEPEVDINSPEKGAAEQLLRSRLLHQANQLATDQFIMLKLTLPEEANFYNELVDHPQVLRVVALSGGYDRAEANRRLSENNGVIASFSRALSQGLSAQQTAAEFDSALDDSVASIFAASNT